MNNVESEGLKIKRGLGRRKNGVDIGKVNIERIKFVERRKGKENVGERGKERKWGLGSNEEVEINVDREVEENLEKENDIVKNRRDEIMEEEKRIESNKEDEVKVIKKIGERIGGSGRVKRKKGFIEKRKDRLKREMSVRKGLRMKGDEIK